MRPARASLTRASEVPYETLCQFLYQEARLLDQRKLSEWNDLFAEGGMYWIPLEEDQEDPLNLVWYFKIDASAEVGCTWVANKDAGCT